MKIGINQRLALTTIVAGIAAPHAFAQAPDNPFFRDRYTAVQDRPQPQFDPVPIRTGSFLLNSSVGVSALLNDNIYSTSTNTVEDTIISINPRADMRSTWSNHALGFGVDVDNRNYMNEDGENTTDYRAYLDGRLDVVRDFSIGMNLQAAKLTEQRYAPAAVTNAAEPTRFDRLGAEANATYRRDRLLLRGELGTASYDFDDVQPVVGTGLIDQDYRDVTETYVGGRASYAVSPDVAVFVQARHINDEYDSVPGFIDRNGTRTNISAGFDFELAAPFRGDVAIGWFENKRDSALLSDIDGLGVNARLLWFPTQITTVTLTASRDTFDPGLINSASAIDTAYGVRVDHELRRNILVFGSLRASNQDFQSITREDDILDASLGLGFRVNRNARFDVGYTMRSQESNIPGGFGDIDQNTFFVGLRLYP